MRSSLTVSCSSLSMALLLGALAVPLACGSKATEEDSQRHTDSSSSSTPAPDPESSTQEPASETDAQTAASEGGTNSRGPRIPAPRPPPPEADEPTAPPTEALTLVVSSWLLGDVNWNGQLEAEAWHAYSFDLDGVRSSADSEDHCEAGGLSYQVDGPDGQDDGFALNLHTTLYNFSESRALSAQSNDAIAQGQHSLLISLPELARRGTQTDVTAFTQLTGVANGKPKFDGSDVWPVIADLATDSADADSATKEQPPSSARQQGYVNDDVFVSTSSEIITVPLSFRGYSLLLRVEQARLSIDLRELRAGGEHVYGVLTGVLNAAQLSDDLQQLAFEMFRTCDAESVAAVSDVGLRDIQLDLTNGAGRRCEGVSFGAGFVASRARAGGTVPAPTPRRPCADGGPVVSSGPLAGTRQSVAPEETAVSCSPVERTNVDRDPETGQCSLERVRGPVCSFPQSSPDCSSHDDCTDGDNGRCYVYGHECTYDECFAHDDCADDELCACGAGIGRSHECQPAGCRSEADCDGFACAPSRTPPCLFQLLGHFCHGPDDECASTEDCEGTEFADCVYSPEQSRWVCDGTHCTIP